MEQSPYSEANSHSASQEIPRLLWNSKVHYRVHMIQSLTPLHFLLRKGSSRNSGCSADTLFVLVISCKVLV